MAPSASRCSFKPRKVMILLRRSLAIEKFPQWNTSCLCILRVFYLYFNYFIVFQFLFVFDTNLSTTETQTRGMHEFLGPNRVWQGATRWRRRWPQRIRDRGRKSVFIVCTSLEQCSIFVWLLRDLGKLDDFENFIKHPYHAAVEEVIPL